jgi:hypothetical protein
MWATEVVPSAGFEPALPPPEAGKTRIVPVYGVFLSLLPCSARHELPWCLMVHCTNPCTTVAALATSNGAESGLRRLPQVVGDPRITAMMGSGSPDAPRVPLRHRRVTMGLDRRHQRVPSYSETSRKSFVCVEGREWQLPPDVVTLALNVANPMIAGGVRQGRLRCGGAITLCGLDRGRPWLATQGYMARYVNCGGLVIRGYRRGESAVRRRYRSTRPKRRL